MHPAAPFFHVFVVAKKREGYTELLSTTRGQEKIRISLDHFNDLDPRLCHRVPSAQQSVAGIVRALKGLGAPDLCYVMSSNSELDGREMNLSDALGALSLGGAWAPWSHEDRNGAVFFLGTMSSPRNLLS